MSLKPPTQNGDVLDLTIRFSASLPDLLLSVPLTNNSNYPNTSSLKQLIRSQLPKEYATHRIRLIHAGKALADEAGLSNSLKRPVTRPPSRISTPGPYDDSESPASKVKGKTPIRDPPISAAARIYIHCSIGDVVLSPSELAAEAALAQPSKGQDGQDGISTSVTSTAKQTETETASTTPAPRGFDRLLSAGFSQQEVQSLRLQFLAIQAHTNTPDSMPSPNTLRNMEDRWLDNSNSTGGGSLSGDGGETGSGAGGGFGEDEGVRGALDDMIYGTAMGFFWPLGCLMWAIREEGIWSQRRKMAVVVGVMLNVGLGLVRYTK